LHACGSSKHEANPSRHFSTGQDDDTTTPQGVQDSGVTIASPGPTIAHPTLIRLGVPIDAD